MASSKKIRPEQLTRARKLLHDLPEKEDGKTRPEAAEFLESDFRKVKLRTLLVKKSLRRPRKKRLRQNNLLSCRIYRMRSYEHECVNFLCRRQ